MGESLYDNISAITDDFNNSAAAAKSMMNRDRALNCSGLFIDINRMPRDLGKRFPDLLNAQAAIARTDLNMGNHDFLKKLRKEFNDNAKDNILVRFDKHPEHKGFSYVASFGRPKGERTLSLYSTGGVYCYCTPIDYYVEHLAMDYKEDALRDVLELTQAARNYADFAENAVKTRANEIAAYSKNIIEAAKSAGENMEKVQEALEASKADYNVSFYGRD